jgi:hypothetical protein
VHFVSAGSLWLCNHRALDLDDTLDKQSIDGGHCLGSLHDDLTDARAIAQVNKYHPTSQPANAVHPPRHHDAFTCMRGQFATQHTFHVNLHI